MIKLTGLIVMSILFISACNTSEEISNSEEQVIIENNAEGNITTDNDTNLVNGDSEEKSDSDTDSIKEENSDRAFDLSIVMDQDYKEIDRDDVHLTKSEFDSSLSELQRSFNENSEEDEEMNVAIDAIGFSGETIEVTLTNNDDSEFSDMTNGFIAAFIDTYYRQLYLHSDYSDGTTHPRIIVQTSDGEVITDEEDFLDFEE